MSGGAIPGQAADPLVGRIISGRYRIEYRLGEGAIGTVYVAEHLSAGQTIALKVLSPQHTRAELVEAFLEEARTVARIGHENVIDVFYGGRSEDGFVFLAMELLKGIDLERAIETLGSMPWERAQPILLQIARALAAVHRQGIIHRDVKPANVFLTPRAGQADLVKVLDFGVAAVVRRTVDGKTGPMALSGTPQYMSPEQIQGRPLDRRADVYALGCLTYHVLTGQPPFESESLNETLTMQVWQRPQPLRQRRPDLKLNAEVDAFVMKALEKAPEARWQSMEEVIAALERLNPRLMKLHNPTTTRRLVLAGSARGLRRRAVLRRLVVGAGTLGALAAVAALGYRFVSHEPARARLEIVTTPSDAVVTFDEVKVDGRSPVIIEAPPGRYALLVTRAGYEAHRQTLELRGGDRMTLSVTLVASERTGLDISSDPIDVPVWLDGVPLRGRRGQAHTPFVARALAPGVHELEIGDRARFRPWRREVRVEPGRLTRVHAVLTRREMKVAKSD